MKLINLLFGMSDVIKLARDYEKVLSELAQLKLYVILRSQGEDHKTLYSDTEDIHVVINQLEQYDFVKKEEE